MSDVEIRCRLRPATPSEDVVDEAADRLQTAIDYCREVGLVVYAWPAHVFVATKNGAETIAMKGVK